MTDLNRYYNSTIAACVVLVSGVLLTKVEAVRIPVMRFFFAVTNQYEVCITYEKDDGACFIVDFWMETPNTALDTEHAKVEQIEIQGSPAILVQKQDGRTYVVWHVNGHQYSVEGYLTKEQALQILESVSV